MLRWGNFCEAWKILSSTSKWCQWNRGRQSGYWVIPLKYSSSISTVLRTWKEWSQLIQCVKCQSTFKFPELRSSRNHRRVSVSSKLQQPWQGLASMDAREGKTYVAHALDLEAERPRPGNGNSDDVWGLAPWCESRAWPQLPGGPLVLTTGWHWHFEVIKNWGETR